MDLPVMFSSFQLTEYYSKYISVAFTIVINDLRYVQPVYTYNYITL